MIEATVHTTSPGYCCPQCTPGDPFATHKLCSTDLRVFGSYGKWCIAHNRAMGGLHKAHVVIDEGVKVALR